LHVTKNHLRALILKCLRNYYGKLSKDAVLKDALRNAEILFYKELYALCESELRRAERIARRYELVAGLVEVLAMRRRLEQQQAPRNYAAFSALFAEQEEAIDRIAAFVTENTSRMPAEYLHSFWFQLAYLRFSRG
jgi:hypothetical protein